MHPKQKEMQDKVDAINRAIREAEEFAEEHRIEFTIQPSYGMGGTYTPARAIDDTRWTPDNGWQSSNNC